MRQGSLAKPGRRRSGFMALGHVGLFCLACVIPRRKGVQHKPYCLYKPFRHSKPHLSVKKCGRTVLISKLLDINQRQNLQAGPCEDNRFRPALLTFLHICEIFSNLRHDLVPRTTRTTLTNQDVIQFTLWVGDKPAPNLLTCFFTSHCYSTC